MQPNPRSFHGKTRTIKAIDNGDGVQSLTELLTRLAIVDPETASYIEKGMVKVLRYLATTGGRLAIHDGKKRLMTLESGAYAQGVRIRAKFDTSLQKQVRSSQATDPTD